MKALSHVHIQAKLFRANWRDEAVSVYIAILPVSSPCGFCYALGQEQCLAFLRDGYPRGGVKQWVVHQCWAGGQRPLVYVRLILAVCDTHTGGSGEGSACNATSCVQTGVLICFLGDRGGAGPATQCNIA